MTMAAGSQLAEASSRVEVRFGTTQPQRRWTVLIRIILVIPQFFVLFFVGIGAFVVAFLGWFAALFTGRLPESFAKFLLGYVRWTTRVYAYEFLMTDVYPPFALDPDPSYPVDVTVTTGRLNRFAVFFRIILVVPAAIVSVVLTYGMQAFGFITWIITLVTGRMPDAIFGASAAAIRWQTRMNAYFWMLTSYYPSDLLGDKDALGKRMEVTVSGTVVLPPQRSPTRPRRRRGTPRTHPSGGPAPTPAWGSDQPTIAAPVARRRPRPGPPRWPPPVHAPAARGRRRHRRRRPGRSTRRSPSRRGRTASGAVTAPCRRAAPPPPPPRCGPGRRPLHRQPPPSGATAAAVGPGCHPSAAAPAGVRTDATPATSPRRTPCRATHRSRCGPWRSPRPPGCWPSCSSCSAPWSASGSTRSTASGSLGPLQGFEKAIARVEVGAAHDSLKNATDTFKTSTLQCESEAESAAIQCLDQAAAALAGAFQTYGDALSRVNYPDSATDQAQAAESAARLASAQVNDLAQSADIDSYGATARSAAFASSLQAVDDTYSALYTALGG